MSAGTGSPNAGAIDEARFRQAAQVYPQPVAAACGRCVRFTTPGAQLDACLKAAEVLCRYLAVLALASLRSRHQEEFPPSVEEPEGPLSFGHYLGLVQAAAKVDGHPLNRYFSPFRARSRRRGPGKADAELTALLELRNEVGHGLSVPEAQARFLMKRDRPHARLLTALGSLEGLLSLPLFVLKTVDIRNRRMYAQRLLLMGESRDPLPDEIELLEPLQDLTPYIAFEYAALPLQPGMFFAEITSRPVQRLALLDKVEDDRLVLQTLDSEVVQEYDARNAWDEIFSNQTSAPHEVRLPEGTESLPKEWSKRRKHIEATVRQTEGVPPWADYDQETLAWYAKRLADRAVRKAVFFNAGYSLVSADALVDGDRSQARNPLIALALRLIGYAELGGSGIRVLQHEWRQSAAVRLCSRQTARRTRSR